jgi:protein-S-isoprenylcysteine O-methyltransferase Ste14
MEKLREKLPNYQGIRLIIIPIVAVLSVCSSLSIMIFFDLLPRVFPNIIFLDYFSIIIPIIGVIISTTIGFLLVYQIWRKRTIFLDKHKEQAYQKAFKYIITGIPFLIAIIVHIFLPVILIIPYPESSVSTWILSRPITDLLFNEEGLFNIFSGILLILSLTTLIIGVMVIRRALLTFGWDYMSLIYLYYPEESQIQNHAIYSILRHPTYHSLLMFGLSAMFLRFSLYSFVFFIIFLIGMTLHIKLVEEKELIQRFGDEYIKYKQTTPAFFIRLKDIRKYFKILVGID